VVAVVVVFGAGVVVVVVFLGVGSASVVVLLGPPSEVPGGKVTVVFDVWANAVVEIAGVAMTSPAAMAK
jgi:hypothetical protein